MAVTSAEAYLDSLTEAQRRVIEPVRDVILHHLPEGYEECISRYGTLSYVVPHSRCPDGYHCNPEDPVPFAGISAKRKKMRLDLFCLYVDPAAKARFVEAWSATGKTLDMGASCVRFSKLEDVAREVLGETVGSIPVDAFLEKYEASVPKSAAKKRGRARPAVTTLG